MKFLMHMTLFLSNVCCFIIHTKFLHCFTSLALLVEGKGRQLIVLLPTFPIPLTTNHWPLEQGSRGMWRHRAPRAAEPSVLRASPPVGKQAGGCLIRIMEEEQLLETRVNWEWGRNVLMKKKQPWEMKRFGQDYFQRLKLIVRFGICLFFSVIWFKMYLDWKVKLWGSLLASVSLKKLLSKSCRRTKIVMHTVKPWNRTAKEACKNTKKKQHKNSSSIAKARR